MNAVAFLALELGGGSGDPLVLILFGAKEQSLVLDGEVWRLLATTFLHADVLHLMLNCVALLMIGQMCEPLFGPRRFAVIYVGSGIAGAVASTVFSPHIAVGASGSIFGLVAAVFVYGIFARERLPQGAFRRFVFVFVAWAALSVWSVVAMPGVDGPAHLGGAVAGAVIAVVALLDYRGDAITAFVAEDRGWRWPARAAALVCAVTLGFAVWSVASGERTAAGEEMETSDLETEGFQIAVPKSWRRVGEGVFVDRHGLMLQVFAVSTSLSPGARVDLIAEGREGRRGKDEGVREIATAAGAKAYALTMTATERDFAILRTIAYVPLGDRVAAVSLVSAPSSRAYHARMFDRILPTVRERDVQVSREAKVEGWIKLVGARIAAARARDETSEAERLAAPEMVDAIELLETSYKSTGRVREIDTLLARTYETLVSVWEGDLAATKDPPADRFNRLAWVYATAAIDRFRKPARAKDLAMRAVAKSNARRPEYIDTLAEAHFASGEFATALATIERAVALSPSNRYYREQRDRFRRAASSQKE